MKKLLLFLLIFSILLFSLDRLAAHLHLPKENSTEVVIYTTQWCPYCRVLRNTLSDYNITFQEYDTEKSIQGFMGYWALRGKGVPISVIGEQVIHGYDGQTITDALVSAGYDIPAEWPGKDQE